MKPIPSTHHTYGLWKFHRPYLLHSFSQLSSDLGFIMKTFQITWKRPLIGKPPYFRRLQNHMNPLKNLVIEVEFQRYSGNRRETKYLCTRIKPNGTLTS